MDDFICYTNSPKRDYDIVFRPESTLETNDYSFERGSPEQLQNLFDSTYFFEETTPQKSKVFNHDKKKKKHAKTPYPLNVKLFGTEETKQTKNIVKNYGNAIVGFVISPISSPYLEEFALQNNISAHEVQKYYSKRKGTISGIKTLRQMLEIRANDSETERKLKSVFRKLSIVFVKYFCVNWIFSGKLKHKLAHLKFRFSILRRVQNPSAFTYLKN